ncbi:MAG: ABC transporter permease [Chloroflexi bacterium]|nr:ABC transporter permease [Chloroflexota bacterium]
MNTETNLKYLKDRSRKNETLENVKYFLKRNPLAVLGLIVLLVIILGCLFAPLLTDYPPTKISIKEKLVAPNRDHVFGTDQLGRDIFSRVLYGGRNTIFIGFVVILISFTIGVSIGIFSGFMGGIVDNIIMRIVDAILSFPTLVLAITFAAVLGPNLQNAMIAVTITMIPQFARISRGLALSVKNLLFVEAARSVGASTWRILRAHILPNAISPLFVQASLNFGSTILQTASLGFLGLGAQPPMPEWGVDVSGASQYIRESPWVALAPGLAILITVLAFNLVGDALADWNNPRARKGN